MPDYGEGSGVTSVSCFIVLERHMQASCQYPDLSQAFDLKRVLKIRCDKESAFLANIQNPGNTHCGYPAKAQGEKKARAVAGPGSS
ncbi:hypothetical protein [Herbaspirillum sp. NPDC101397]|uniref:hypothetical protein n=1 Tax=Herbaspirillum sp. NPDC101397 TaxID=3364006 RepID=UPI00383B8FB3